MRNSIFLTVSVLFSLYLLSGCRKTLNDDTLKISYGTYFGMCSGFCNQEIRITKDQIRFNKRKNGVEHTLINCNQNLSTAHWAQLKGQINYRKFAALEEVMGCPDCADGGAEWIEIQSGERKHKITFEYGHAPEEVKAYIGKLREIKESFKDCK